MNGPILFDQRPNMRPINSKWYFITSFRIVGSSDKRPCPDMVVYRAVIINESS